MGSHDHPSGFEGQVLLLDILARATAEGWQAGRDTENFAGDCPYSDFLAPLRQAWLDGFSVGRVSSQRTSRR